MKTTHIAKNGALVQLIRGIRNVEGDMMKGLEVRLNGTLLAFVSHSEAFLKPSWRELNKVDKESRLFILNGMSRYASQQSSYASFGASQQSSR